MPQSASGIKSSVIEAEGQAGSNALLINTLKLIQEICGTSCCLLLQEGIDQPLEIREIYPQLIKSEKLDNFPREIYQEYGENLKKSQILRFSFPNALSCCLFTPKELSYPINTFSLFPLIHDSSYLGTLCLGHSEPQSTRSAEDNKDKIQILVEHLGLILHELERKNLSQSQFFSHLTHELRAPLTSILGFSKMLREEYFGALNEKQKQYIRGIVAAGEHLLALVNDFLDLSKIDAQREELFLEKVAVADVCLATVSMIEAQVKEVGLELSVDIASDVGICLMDQRRIKQILINLLSNAIKFTKAGRIILKVRLSNNKIFFSVIDTGAGIKTSDLLKLFQPFQQIDTPLNRKQKGTGLGLTLSRKLAQLHGGDLDVISEENQGSCFTLHIPVKN